MKHKFALTLKCSVEFNFSTQRLVFINKLDVFLSGHTQIDEFTLDWTKVQDPATCLI